MIVAYKPEKALEYWEKYAPHYPEETPILVRPCDRKAPEWAPPHSPAGAVAFGTVEKRIKPRLKLRFEGKQSDSVTPST